MFVCLRGTSAFPPWSEHGLKQPCTCITGELASVLVCACLSFAMMKRPAEQVKQRGLTFCAGWVPTFWQRADGNKGCVNLRTVHCVMIAVDVAGRAAAPYLDSGVRASAALAEAQAVLLTSVEGEEEELVFEWAPLAPALDGNTLWISDFHTFEGAGLSAGFQALQPAACPAAVDQLLLQAEYAVCARWLAPASGTMQHCLGLIRAQDEAAAWAEAWRSSAIVHHVPNARLVDLNLRPLLERRAGRGPMRVLFAFPDSLVFGDVSADDCTGFAFKFRD